MDEEKEGGVFLIGRDKRVTEHLSKELKSRIDSVQTFEDSGQAIGELEKKRPVILFLEAQLPQSDQLLEHATKDPYTLIFIWEKKDELADQKEMAADLIFSENIDSEKIAEVIELFYLSRRFGSVQVGMLSHDGLFQEAFSKEKVNQAIKFYQDLPELTKQSYFQPFDLIVVGEDSIEQIQTLKSHFSTRFIPIYLATDAKELKIDHGLLVDGVLPRSIESHFWQEWSKVIKKTEISQRGARVGYINDFLSIKEFFHRFYYILKMEKECPLLFLDVEGEDEELLSKVFHKIKDGLAQRFASSELKSGNYLCLMKGKNSRQIEAEISIFFDALKEDDPEIEKSITIKAVILQAPQDGVSLSRLFSRKIELSSTIPNEAKGMHKVFSQTPKTGIEIFSEKKIILFSDTKVLIDMIQYLYSQRGCKVDVCSSGKEGISYLKEQKELSKIHLIIVDFSPENQNTIATLQQIKDHVLAQVPILVLVESFKEELLSKAIQMGIDGYLNKPFDLLSLIRRSEQLIR